jgi:hypothetical protein
MLCMCVYMHSRFIENHSIRILEDRLLISEVVLSQSGRSTTVATTRGGWQLHSSPLLVHHASLNGHCSTYQTCVPLTGHCSTIMRVRLGNM